MKESERKEGVRWAVGRTVYSFGRRTLTGKEADRDRLGGVCGDMESRRDNSMVGSWRGRWGKDDG